MRLPLGFLGIYILDRATEAGYDKLEAKPMNFPGGGVWAEEYVSVDMAYLNLLHSHSIFYSVHFSFPP